jgi:hypothetical protein
MSVEIDGCTCIGSPKASAFIVQSKNLEDEVFENYDDNGKPLGDWAAIIKHLKDRYNSGEVYELSGIH